MEHILAMRAAPPPVIPASPPPPGVTANFVNPPSISNRVVVVTSIFLALSWIAVSLRMYTRIKIVRGFGKDDVVLLLALLFSTAESAMNILLTKHGLGRHIWDVPLTTLTPTFLKLDYISSILYGFAILFLKMSILLMYLRLSPVKLFRYCVYFLLFAVVGFGIGGIPALIFACVPIKKVWDLTVTGGHCITLFKLSIGNAYFNVFTDIALLVLPLPTIWGLQLPLQQKLALTAVFSTGIFCVGVAITRLVEIQPLLKSPDITYNIATAAMYSILELDTGMICTSLATLQPFLRLYAPGLIGGSRKSQYPQKEYHQSSNDYWKGSRGNKSYGINSTSGKSEMESLELGDGPKAETKVSAHRDAEGHEPTPGIVKTTDVEVQDSDAQYMGRSTR